MSFTEEQTSRYARHFVLDRVGAVGQERLLAGRVLCIGAGGLGCAASLYLVAAGVGTLGIVDSDRIEMSNLNRQILHVTRDIGRSKVLSAEETAAALNPDVRIEGYPERLGRDNVREISSRYDVIVDGSDDFPTRLLIADAAALMKKPMVTGSVFQFQGQATTILPGEGNPCFRCLLSRTPSPRIASARSRAGVLGAVAGTIGTLQATEVIKLILGAPCTLVGKLVTYDALTGEWQTLPYSRSADCPLCGDKPVIHEIGSATGGAGYTTGS